MTCKMWQRPEKEDVSMLENDVCKQNGFTGDKVHIAFL